MIQEIETEVCIVGGGMGGCAAAIALGRMGVPYVLIEETWMLGGQCSSQAVPPDEHKWIEEFGCTETYRKFRELAGRAIRKKFLIEEANNNPLLNPGGGWVSNLCIEPLSAEDACSTLVMGALNPDWGPNYIGCKLESCRVEGDRIAEITAQFPGSDKELVIKANYFLDATEYGDLLNLSSTEYVTGSESRKDTGELHAKEVADPHNIQAFTWCFAMAWDPGHKEDIFKPREYEKWREFVPQVNPPWPGPLLSWTFPDVRTLQPKTFKLWGDWGLFKYRQVVDPSIYKKEVCPVTIVNWPQNDCMGHLYDPPEGQHIALLDAAQLNLSLLYWLQTEAPRDEGGYGYPELRLAPEITRSSNDPSKPPYHPFALAPYVRESRRIRAEFTVCEQHVGVEARPGASSAEPFADSVGIGAYRIDLHPTTGGDNFLDISAYPFQIPLGSLIPIRMENLLPACKNLGVTHITNGCFRLHPVEWNIGESAGALAGFCIKNNLTPRQVYKSKEHTREFQNELRKLGVELEWPDGVHAL